MDILTTVLRAIAPLVTKPMADQVQRNQLFIKTLKACGFDPEHPPADFSTVYSYTLVEYALLDERGKPKALLNLFADPEIKAGFKRAFDEWRLQPLDDAVAQRLDWKEFGNEWNSASNEIRELNIDVQQEVALFRALFLGVVQRSQTPKEQWQSVKLNDVHRLIQSFRAEWLEAHNPELLAEAVADKVVGKLQAALPVSASSDDCQASELAVQVDGWFESLGYEREASEVKTAEYCEWVIHISTRRGYDRILIRCISGEAGMAQLEALKVRFEEVRLDEGWLISPRRISPAVKTLLEDRAYRGLYCYTLDGVIDQIANFDNYLEWLEGEIVQRGINTDYIPLGCSKADVDVKTQKPLGVSHYDEIEEYVDQWLDDSSKEHLSVLGEFGTGKTWFSLHYAWLALQKYKDAKAKGVERPRLPLVIPLRDYAKAVSVESLFSEFFFKKHETGLRRYSAFQQMNRMGKLLIIFDGFDEMAARIDRQSMIDNFWELASVVGPGAKAILTCRTEHFPDAIEGRQLLGADLPASTTNVRGEPPRFEVLELAKFSDGQIAQLLGQKAKESTVNKVLGDSQLLDLARRPVMVDLILDALPEIEAGKPVDMARVYLYAVTKKIETDIKSDRTFTSMADKLYFLCELSWEMISTDRMSLNYRAFPERLQQMFADRVKEEKELDHWRYDMMGQTMLIRNSEGDYSPAHRSLLEFFVAYKIVASLGAMADDFTAVARQQSHLAEGVPSRDYTWESYFKRVCNAQGNPEEIAGLGEFEGIGIDELLPLLGQSKLAKAVLDLAHPMIDTDTMRERLLPLLQATAQRTLKEAGYLGGNVAQLMLATTPHALIDSDLSGAKLRGVDFTRTFLRRVNLQGAQLAEAPFSKVLGGVNSVAYSPDGEHIAIGDNKGILQVWAIATGQVVLFCSGHSDAINLVVYSPDGHQLATGSDDSTVKLWNARSGECERTLTGHENVVRSVVYSLDGQQLATGGDDSTVKLWNARSGECERTLTGHENVVRSVAYSPDGQQLATGSDDSTVKLWNARSGECERTLTGHENVVRSVVYSPDGQQLATGSSDSTVKLWNATSGECERTLTGHEDWVRSVAYSPDGQQLATGSDDSTVKLWNARSGECERTLTGHENVVRSVAYSPDGQQLATGSDDRTVKLWNASSGECERMLTGHEDWMVSVVYSPDGQQLATGGDNRTVKLWNARSSECERTLTGHEDWVMSVVYSPDGQQLATGSYDRTVKLWNARSGECKRTLTGHENWVTSVVYSPDGQQLATGSYDRTVKLWNARSGECERTLTGHDRLVLSVAYSPDGQQLATGSDDSTVKLWNASSGECERTLAGHDRLVMSVVYSPDGQQLATGSYDNTIRIWNVATGECLRVIDDRVCAGLNITGTMGLSAGQRTVLKLMGAVDYGED